MNLEDGNSPCIIEFFFEADERGPTWILRVLLQLMENILIDYKLASRQPIGTLSSVTCFPNELGQLNIGSHRCEINQHFSYMVFFN